MCHTGWNARHQVEVRIGNSPSPRTSALETSLYLTSQGPRQAHRWLLPARDAKRGPASGPGKPGHRTLGSGPVLSGWTASQELSWGRTGWRTSDTLAAVRGCSCEPARAAGERSGAVLTRAGKTGSCLSVVGL